MKALEDKELNEVQAVIDDLTGWAITLRERPTTTLTTIGIVKAFNASIDRAKLLSNRLDNIRKEQQFK